MFFRNARGWTQNDVEKALGVSKNYISRVKQGHSTGSGQLFSGLSLLKRVIELENQPPPKTTRQMVLELEDRVASLEKTVLGRYPEHRPANLELNEPVNSSSKALAAVEGAMVKLVDAAVAGGAGELSSQPRPDRPDGTKGRKGAAAQRARRPRSDGTTPSAAAPVLGC